MQVRLVVAQKSQEDDEALGPVKVSGALIPDLTHDYY